MEGVAPGGMEMGRVSWPPWVDAEVQGEAQKVLGNLFFLQEQNQKIIFRFHFLVRNLKSGKRQ